MADIGRIDQTTDPECPTITMVGEFDLSNAPDLVRRFDELAAASVPRVIIDMTKTSFIDSTVLGAFGLAYRRGLHLTIRGASDVVRRHLDSSGLAAIFDIE